MSGNLQLQRNLRIGPLSGTATSFSFETWAGFFGLALLKSLNTQSEKLVYQLIWESVVVQKCF